jgi:hypothetical protein
MFGAALAPGPDFRCSHCRTEANKPPEKPLTFIENFEDYRRSCAAQVDGMRKGRVLGGGLWTEEQENRLSQLERFVRILDVMPVEDRLGTEPPGPEQRAVLAAASGTSREDVEQLFAEFAWVHEIHERARRQKVPVWPRVIPVVLGLPIFGAALFVRLTGTAAAIVSGFGYYLLAVLLVFLILTRVPNARRLAFSSQLRQALFLVVVPALLAAGAVGLLHEHIVRAGWEEATVSMGFIAIGGLLFWALAMIEARLMIRRLLRQANAAQPDGNPGEVP